MDKKKSLPFRHSLSSQRQNEEVRPVFWSNKPQSYRERTQNWDEFPNGRWGLSKSPAFDQDEGFVSFSKKYIRSNIKEKLGQWGQKIHSLSQVSEVFTNFLSGKIKRFPFSEGSLALETEDISEFLLYLNKNKILTINSQPQVNGAKSTHPKYGWGPERGYVYQKAYYEFFIHPSLILPLINYLNNFEDISYQAINFQGESFQNVEDENINAITWGVFNNHEIIQPTVVDHQAFLIWKDECFRTFTETWAAIYKPQKDKEGNLTGGDDESIKFLTQCRDTLFLVNVVQNDFIGGDLNKILEQFVTEHQEAINKL